MNRKSGVFAIAVAFIVCAIIIPSGAFAHEETTIGNVTIVGGWSNEPPLLDQMNGIELTVTRDGSPVANALAETDISIRKGGLSKPLDFTPGEEQGHYVADILPTQLGEYAVVFTGTVAGQVISGQAQIEIESVEDVRLVSFPDPGQDGPDQEVIQRIVDQLTNVISDLTSQVEESNARAENAETLAQESIAASEDLRGSADRAYIFGMIGVGIGAAGVIIAVIAISRSKA